MSGHKTAHITEGAYHLARKSGNFGLKSNGKVISRKFRSEIVEFAKLSSFQSLISRKQLLEIELQMVR